MEPISSDKDDGSSSRKEANHFVHSVHTCHIPSSDGDPYVHLFLSVHPYVLDMAKENLKRLISTSIVGLASKQDEPKIKIMVTNLERVAYHFLLYQRSWPIEARYTFTW